MAGSTSFEGDNLAQDLEDLQLHEDAVEKLLQRSRILLEELDVFIARFEENCRTCFQGVEKNLSYRHFQNDIRTDVSGLQKLVKEKLNGSARQIHVVSSSNIPFLEAVWAAAKSSEGVTSLRGHRHAVDVTAEGGARWIKVSTISERRIIMELAKQGWGWESDSEDNEKARLDTYCDLPIVKMAKKLVQMSKESPRVHYRRPKIHFLLPRIQLGRSKEVDEVIQIIRTLGISVNCAGDIPSPPPIQECVDRMIFDSTKHFSDVLNIDCTILLAMVSDISHAQVEPADRFSTSIRRQLDLESKEHLLPRIIWPAITGHTLVCTQEAASRMREIVDTIGTTGERARTAALFDDDKKGHEGVISAFRDLSVHDIPSSWKLPMTIVEDVTADDPRLPPMVENVASQLTDINRSVFLYGWATRRTTLTSNRTVVRQIEGILGRSDSLIGEENAVGPEVWICWTSRSLVAKEKERRG